MNQRITVRNSADLAAIEACGWQAFLPSPTPLALIEDAARKRPDHCALHYLADIDDPSRNLRISYAALARKIRQAANLFRRLGVGPTDGVALLMPHVPAAQIALWGAEIAGRACPVNPMLRPEHIAALMTAAGAKVAVVLGANRDMDIWNTIVPALREAGCVSHILHADADGPTGNSDGCFEDLAENENGDRLDFDPPMPDAVAACFHTGGTTGAPKLALHTHRNQAFVARSAALMYDLRPDDVLINGFPLFHVAGAFVYGLSVLSGGGTLLIPTRLGMRNRSFVGSIWKHVAEHRVTAIGGVPTVISALNAVAVDADISSLRVMLTGGSPLPTELADAFERGTGKPVRNILGMTECAGVVTIEPFLAPRVAGSTGLRLPFTQVKIFRASAGGAVDTASPCATNESGVVALRGPNVGPGYSDISRNPGTFEGDWLISGDLGHIDAEDRLFVTGRAKDVIIRGAHNIDPAMIEDALLGHPDVAIAAAIGQPDAYAGELPVAFVTLKAGATVSGEDLRRYLEPVVSEPAALPKYVAILPDLPVTPVGKIYKPALRLLATKHAIESALTGAGLEAAAFEIAASEAENVIHVGNEGDAATARRALQGMPIRYDIRQGARPSP